MERSLTGDLRQIVDLFVRTGRELPRMIASRRGISWLVLVASFAMTAFLNRDALVRTLAVGYPTPDPPTIAFDVSWFLNEAAGGAGMVVLGTLAYVIGRLTKSELLVDTAIVFAAAGLWSFAFTFVGQFVLEDGRPREGGVMHFFGMHGHGVSGHASAASLLLSPVHDVLLQRASPRTRNTLATACFAWAMFIAWSRVYLGMHHAWNVVLGLAVGFFCARAATIAYARKGPSSLA